VLRVLLYLPVDSGPLTVWDSKRARESQVASKVSDLNTRAADVVAQAAGQTPKRKKDPAAVARGRLGGQARARNTPPEVRSNDAREAVNARWAAKKSRGKAANPRKFAPPEVCCPRS
jgi:hypothetical protein